MTEQSNRHRNNHKSGDKDRCSCPSGPSTHHILFIQPLLCKHPSLPFVFYYWEHTPKKANPVSEGGIYFGPKQRTVGDSVGRDGNSWTRCGDSCPEVLRISSVLRASEADSATVLSLKLSRMQENTPDCSLKVARGKQVERAAKETEGSRQHGF